MLVASSSWTNCDSRARLPARTRILREAGATLNIASATGTEAKRRLRRGRAGEVKRGHAAQASAKKETRRLHLLNSVQKLVNSGLLPGALASGESRGYQGLRASGHPRPHDRKSCVPGSSPGLAIAGIPCAVRDSRRRCLRGAGAFAGWVDTDLQTPRTLEGRVDPALQVLDGRESTRSPSRTRCSTSSSSAPPSRSQLPCAARRSPGWAWRTPGCCPVLADRWVDRELARHRAPHRCAHHLRFARLGPDTETRHPKPKGRRVENSALGRVPHQ